MHIGVKHFTHLSEHVKKITQLTWSQTGKMSNIYELEDSMTCMTPLMGSASEQMVSTVK